MTDIILLQVWHRILEIYWFCKNPATLPLLEAGEQAQALYAAQSHKAMHDFLIKGIELANECDLKFKVSQNQRLLVELCLMQLASITFDGEKKK